MTRWYLLVELFEGDRAMMTSRRRKKKKKRCRSTEQTTAITSYLRMNHAGYTDICISYDFLSEMDFEGHAGL